MPVLTSSYSPPRFLGGGHVLTIYPNLWRKVPPVAYLRERIDTPDGDFLDLDWSRRGAPRLGIVSHGLEGNSTRAYVMGMVRALNQGGWDALAWNFRGCGGQINRKPRLYHSGATDDLHTVVTHALAQGGYGQVALIGFSLGGNMTLKYLGERGAELPSAISRGVAFSTPCDLASGAAQSARLPNRIYIMRFLRLLHGKIKAKMKILPGVLDDRGYGRIKNFEDFDNRYTAPLHGFADAQDYWRRASSRPWLPFIGVPTLLVNALDDPLLGPGCFPWQEARDNPCLFLETPVHGGHVGFVTWGDGGRYWSERRALEFLNGTLPGAPEEGARP